MSVTDPAVEQGLRFEILGPLRGWRFDEELDLGPAKQHAVLAVLLLNANRPVAPSTIIDAVWPDDPPVDGANVVQKYVAGLRRAFEPDRSPRTPSQLITLTPAGYVLRVGEGMIDADRFADGVRHARAERAEGLLLEASAHLDAVLRLWRGDPLTGLTGPLFDARRELLRDERAAALEAWAEIELGLGHHAEILADLGRMVAEYPFRERMRGLQMLALYRDGRRTEALAEYQETRRFLAAEFGVDPGQQLQDLHQRILRGDPGLGAASPGSQAYGFARSPGAPAGAGPASAAGAAGAAQEVRGGFPWRLVVSVVVAVVVPLVSLGMLSWAWFTVVAVRRRSVLLGVAAVGYLAATAAMLATSEPEATPLQDTIFGVGLVVSMFAAPVHGVIAVLAREAPRDG
jgi:DNA-binding SARP family transcriptional activator